MYPSGFSEWRGYDAANAFGPLDATCHHSLHCDCPHCGRCCSHRGCLCSRFGRGGYAVATGRGDPSHDASPGTSPGTSTGHCHGSASAHPGVQPHRRLSARFHSRWYSHSDGTWGWALVRGCNRRFVRIYCRQSQELSRRCVPIHHWRCAGRRTTEGV